MVSLQEARRTIAEKLSPLQAVRMPLERCLGKRLAEDVRADADYPAGDRAMMDGYVVRADAVPGGFRVRGEIAAGAVPARTLAAGEAVRVFTGALLPEDGGRVIMQEDVRAEGDRIVVETFGGNLFIRRAGSEAREGDVVLGEGSILGAPGMAALAQVGAVNPSVTPFPRVRHIATGTEIIDPRWKPAVGEIRDTNSTLLAALFKGAGVEACSSSRVTDDLERLIGLAAEPADLLVISGGAGGGDYDFGAAALRRLGFEIHFDRVNLRPGKPLIFATRGAQAAFVVPGNPISHFVCFQTAIRLAIERLAGLPDSWNPLHATLAGGAEIRPDPRETYWPARAFAAEGKLCVEPKPWSTSGNTFALAGTNALIRVDGSFDPTGPVEILLLDTTLSR